MVVITRTQNNLARVLIKYSDIEIAQYFQKSSVLKHQISVKYTSDPVKRNLIIQNIIDRHIEFKRALCDPTILNNAIVIEDHHKYFWDAAVIENGQIRGPQVHLSQQMFSDFGYALNGISNTNLSGAYLGSLVSTKKPSVVSYPVDLNFSSPSSFRQGYELQASKAYSIALNYNVHYTNDDPKNIPSYSKLINNMPPNQKIGDISVEHDKLKGIVSQTDIKSQSVGVAVSRISKSFNTPRVVFTGTTDISDYEAAFQIHVNEALNNINNISHVDSCKDNLHEKYLILTRAKASNDVLDTRGIIGLPCIITNE